MQKTKVLEVSDFYKIGGAAIAANRICTSLLDNNLGFHRISSNSSEPNASLFLGRKIQLIRDFLDMMKLSSLASRIASKEIIRQFNLALKRYAPDSILIHNIHGAGWPIEFVVSALNHAPTTWILHDCWSFLGTYYPSHVPRPSANITEDLKNFWGKKIPRGENCHPFSAITPSRWMSEQAKNSYWNEYSVEVIHNPIPDSFFREKDRSSCKKSLGLKEDYPVVLCIAGNLNEERKGGEILREIIRASCNENLQFLVIGEGDLIQSIDSERVKCLGFIKDEITIQIAYSASDILMHTAPVDNLPNTVAEAMSCGTPVLAFQTGGLPEMVIPKKSGWLVKKICPKQMIQELKEILIKHDYENLRESTRSTAKLLFDRGKIAQSYEEHILNQQSSDRNK